jgi:hypothetical protein
MTGGQATALEFLSSSLVERQLLASPLRRALSRAPGRFRDLSLDPKVEIRGDLGRFELAEGDELIRLEPQRGILLPGDAAPAAVERARAARLRAWDVSSALAGVALEGERLLHRLTDLDLDALPAVGSFAGVHGILVRDAGERFRAYFPQELGHSVCELVLDAHEGLIGT